MVNKKLTCLNTAMVFHKLQGMICSVACLGLLLSAPSAWAAPGKNKVEATNSSNIALSQGGKLLFNVNREANSVTVFQVGGGGKGKGNGGLVKIDEVPVGREPICVAVGESKAFVANSGSGTVSVINKTKRGYGVATTIPVGPRAAWLRTDAGTAVSCMSPVLLAARCP